MGRTWLLMAEELCFRCELRAPRLPLNAFRDVAYASEGSNARPCLMSHEDET